MESPGLSSRAPVENVNSSPGLVSKSANVSANGDEASCWTLKAPVPTPGSPSAPPQIHSEPFQLASVEVAARPATRTPAEMAATLRPLRDLGALLCEFVMIVSFTETLDRNVTEVTLLRVSDYIIRTDLRGQKVNS